MSRVVAIALFVAAAVVVLGALVGSGWNQGSVAVAERDRETRTPREPSRSNERGKPDKEKPSAAQPDNEARRDCESTRPAVPNTIGFWDTQGGLIGGGDMFSARCPGTVSLTTDGGRSFVVVLETESAVGWIDTAGDQDAWVVTQDHRNRHRLLHSGDNGITWELVSSDPPYAPSFSTPTDGMAIKEPEQSYGGAVLQGRRVVLTRDGGETWSRVETPCLNRDYAGAQVAMATPKDALAVCVEEGYAGMSPKVIYRTKDSGRSWDRVVGTESCTRFTGICGISHVQGLTLDKSGAAALWVVDQPAYLTWDFGKTWSHRRNGRGPYAYTTPRAQPVSGRAAVALVGYHGRPRLSITDDRGAHWRVVNRWP